MDTPFQAARGIAVSILCSTMFLASARAADSLSEPWSGADATDDPAYRKAIKEGLAEYDALHFEEARSLFRRAHSISPNARTLRGLGMTSFELRDYVSAVRNLSAALQDKRKPLSAEQRVHTQDLLDRSRMFVDTYTLTVSPANARVIIDGHAPEFESDGTLLFGFGTHTLEASARGRAVRSVPIAVRGGERKELSVTLALASAVGARSGDARVAEVVTAARPEPAVASNRSAAAWLWASGGAALLAVGAGIYWLRQNSQLNSCRNPLSPWACTNESTLKTQWNVGLGATVGTGAAALTMALIGILSWDFGHPPAANHSALGCNVGPLSIACARSF
jgi:tetratricopeptide (TPR) repeat protein